MRPLAAAVKAVGDRDQAGLGRDPPRSNSRALWLGAMLCLVIGAAVSEWLGPDANYDLQAYHLQNGAALLHGTFWRDLLPVDMQSYLNPLLDAVYAGLALGPLLHHPRALAAIMGLPFGAVLFLAWRLADRLQPGRPVTAAMAAVLGCSSAGLASQIGTTFNEVQLAAVMLAGLLVLLRGGPWRAAGAGALFGVAAGLKLTGIVYAPAACLAAACMAPDARTAMRAAAACALAWLLGFAAVDGWWAAMLTERFASPVFPLFNGIVRSPWYPPASFTDGRFLPDGIAAGLFRPVLALWGSGTLSSEVAARDGRGALVLCLGLVTAAAAVLRRRGPLPPPARAILAFLAMGYVCWVFTSGILRYAAVLEVAAGCAVPTLLAALLPADWAAAALLASLAVLLPTTRYPSWGRMPYGETTLHAEWGPIEPGTLVVATLRSNLGWMLALLPDTPGLSVVGLGFATADARGYRLRDETARLVADHHGPIAVLTAGRPGEPAYELGEIGLDPVMDDCRPISGTFVPPERAGPMVCAAHSRALPRLPSPFWAQAAARYRTLLHPRDEDWTLFGETYLQSAGPAARGTHIIDWMDLLWTGVGTSRGVLPAQFDPGTLYVLSPDDAQRAAPRIDPASDALGVVDGVTVLAPGWLKCRPCTTIPAAIVMRAHLDLPLPPLGQTLHSPNRKLLTLLATGWAKPGQDGIWSDGIEASLRFERPSPGPLLLTVEGAGFAPQPGGVQAIAVLVNGVPVAQWQAADLQDGSYAALLPAGPDDVTVQLRIMQPARPLDRGMNGDTRSLGFLLRSVRVDAL